MLELCALEKNHCFEKLTSSKFIILWVKRIFLCHTVSVRRIKCVLMGKKPKNARFHLVYSIFRELQVPHTQFAGLYCGCFSRNSNELSLMVAWVYSMHTKLSLTYGRAAFILVALIRFLFILDL